MANEMKTMETELVKAYRKKDPESFERRELIFRMLAVMVGSRVLYSILFVGYALAGGIVVPGIQYVMLLVMVAVALAFAKFIYSAGIKYAAYIGIGGGVYSLLMAYGDGTFHAIGAVDAFLSAVLGMLVISAVIQIAVMAFIAFDNKCKLYMSVMAEIRRDLLKYAGGNLR